MDNENFIQNHSVLIDHQNMSLHTITDYNSRTEII